MKQSISTPTLGSSNNIDEFEQYLNRQHNSIKFTCERDIGDGLPFLDALVYRTNDNHLKIAIYRKPTNTGSYLHFNSHHPLHQKIGIVKTLFNRYDNIVSENNNKVTEKEKITNDLHKCGYPKWAIEKGKRLNNIHTNTENKEKCKNIVVLPYLKGMSEKLARVYKKHDVQLISKPKVTF